MFWNNQIGWTLVINREVFIITAPAVERASGFSVEHPADTPKQEEGRDNIPRHCRTGRAHIVGVVGEAGGAGGRRARARGGG